MQSFRTSSAQNYGRSKQNAKRYLLGALFLANLLIWHAVLTEEKGGVLTVAFLDVGQGDSIFIEAPNGNQMLVDGGPSRQVLKALSGVMPFYDRKIDVVLATHPDQDHIGGLPAVFDAFTVDFFIEPGVRADTAAYKELLRDVSAEKAEHLHARRGMRIVLGGGVFLDVLFPDRDVAHFDANDASIVAKLIYGGSAFLLTGDAPEKIEKYLAVIDAGNLKVDVLKVGHHGSKTSTADRLLAHAAPVYAIISAGRGNRYGHPHETVLARLEEFGAAVFRTDRAGTIIFETDGQSIGPAHQVSF